MSEPELIVSRDSGIAFVSLNRPAKLNSLSRSVMSALIQTFDSMHSDSEVRAVVLTGAGPKAFCAGRDLEEVAGSGLSPHDLPMRGLQRNVFEVILECGKPTIAAIFGHTLGGGAELALACDIRVAASDLKFGFPEATVGLGANFGSVMLPRLIPIGFAYELLYTGRRIGAEEAYRLGLVNHVVQDDAVGAASAIAEALSKNAPLTQQRYKAMITKARELPVAAALRLDAAPNPYLSHDRVEGVTAWREGRLPRWSGT